MISAQQYQLSSPDQPMGQQFNGQQPNTGANQPQQQQQRIVHHPASSSSCSQSYQAVPVNEPTFQAHHGQPSNTNVTHQNAAQYTDSYSESDNSHHHQPQLPNQQQQQQQLPNQQQQQRTYQYGV